MITNRSFLVCLLAALSVSLAAQKPDRHLAHPPKTVVFAVIDGGRTVEPIGFVLADKVSAVGEGDNSPNFQSSFYTKDSVYTLIFGGAPGGTLNINKSNIGTECGGNSAQVTAHPAEAKLSGFVMALATNAHLDSRPGLRRRPTDDERAAVEALVRERFMKEGASRTSVKDLRYHNLTAMDLDHDGTPELIGSYWAEPTPAERRLLFFVAEKGKTGGFKLAHAEHARVTARDIMSADLADVDKGLGAELLVDAFDYDADGMDEIFTIGKAFEGNNYYVYKRQKGKWQRVFETYNYRCGY